MYICIYTSHGASDYDHFQWVISQLHLLATPKRPVSKLKLAQARAPPKENKATKPNRPLAIRPFQRSLDFSLWLALCVKVAMQTCQCRLQHVSLLVATWLWPITYIMWICWLVLGFDQLILMPAAFWLQHWPCQTSWSLKRCSRRETSSTANPARVQQSPTRSTKPT